MSSGPPTHFVAFRLGPNDRLWQNVADTQAGILDNVRAADPGLAVDLEACVIPPRDMHITLCVMRLREHAGSRREARREQAARARRARAQQAQQQPESTAGAAGGGGGGGADAAAAEAAAAMAAAAARAGEVAANNMTRLELAAECLRGCGNLPQLAAFAAAPAARRSCAEHPRILNPLHVTQLWHGISHCR